MTTMHTQDQTIWTPQLCGLPQVKERCTPDVVSPERPGLQGTVCNDHHTTGHLRQTNKTHLNMIKHFQDLWEQDFCRDTQLSIHCPFLWAYLRKSRCRQDIVASLLKDFLTSKFCSVKQDQDGQQGTFGRFFCRDKVKRSLESIFKTEVFNSKHSILLKPLCLIVGGGVVFWLVCLCTKYHLNYAFPNLDIASKATQTEGTAHSLRCLK